VRDGEFEIETTPGRDARPEIARAVVNGGWPLLEIHREALSLEKIFIELTKDETPAAEAAA